VFSDVSVQAVASLSAVAVLPYFSSAAVDRVGIKKPTQKNPPKKTQKNPPKKTH
jgi:hypothetical protein